MSDTEVRGATGLTSAEAAARLAEFGPNKVAEEHEHPLKAIFSKLWAPVPWMLEATIVLEMLLHKSVEAIVIAVLLLFNAVLSLAQEGHARNALSLLRQRLTVQVRAQRDGEWRRIAAEAIVPDDLIYLRVGDIVPADIRILAGDVLIDHSAVTGESAPVDAGAGAKAWAGGIVRRGEASAAVTATGSRTYFGKTAELVREAKGAGHLQQMIFTIVKYLVAFDALIAAAVLIFALLAGMGWGDILPFCLMLLVASIPVALPATFTLASALGTQELARRGVLVSRLAAIEEAAAMDALATDKTGTLTKNQLSVAEVTPIAPNTEPDVIRNAALASDEATQDPIDMAILAAARERSIGAAGYIVRKFIPFDPSTKCSEARVEHGMETLRVIKGAPGTIASMTGAAMPPEAERLAGEGYRVLAVAAGPEEHVALTGLIALLDPPRDDSASLVASLHSLGVRVLMVTGDGLATARTVAQQVGIAGEACSSERLQEDTAKAAADCGIFGGVFPEDKYRLVQALQKAGHVSGMTGDGVNDAPALRQAEVGIAVANATDVAKAAASIVLTNPGLTDVVAAIETSRRIYQRMLTYTLNKIIKTIEIAVFLSLGLVFTRTLVVTPVLIVLLLFTNDFLTMSIATDHVSFSQRPERWSIRTLMLTAAPLAGLLVLFSLAILFTGLRVLRLEPGQIPTLVFLTLVFGGQGTVYLVRERGHFWSSRPSAWMLCSSCADFAIVSALAMMGVLMPPVRGAIVLGLLISVLLYLAAVDFFKVRIFRLFGVR
ncbi:MAG TPA: plasma-membrane proton-efflux P-type ATPase [Bryobacteraceae bacterium]|nr:plasma-membrane proton-efflux P-type ATPase [Bryobacteraceae bacterium]